MSHSGMPLNSYAVPWRKRSSASRPLVPPPCPRRSRSGSRRSRIESGQCTTRSSQFACRSRPSTSLTDEVRQRLRREDLESTGLAAGASEEQGQTVVDRRAPTCAEPAAGTADRIMRAIAPAAYEQQRAGLEALPQRSIAMAQLIAGSCPSDAHLDDPMARF